MALSHALAGLAVLAGGSFHPVPDPGSVPGTEPGTGPAPTRQVDVASSRIELTVSSSTSTGSPTAAQRLAGSSVTLSCDPPSGTHPRPSEACVALERAHGDFNRLAEDSGQTYCTMVYSPVTASARGTWHGSPVEFTATYSNGCTMNSRTAEVFRF